MKQRKDYLVRVPDDGLPAADIGPWGKEKYRRIGMYAEMFSTGMKNRWDHRVYIELFAGSGHAVIRPGGPRVMTSPPQAALRASTRMSHVACGRV
jgi:hypothetical protein